MMRMRLLLSMKRNTKPCVKPVWPGSCRGLSGLKGAPHLMAGSSFSTEAYGKDTKEVVAALNEVLATEIVCWMRYSRHAISASGINRALLGT
jgi:hypothetical protein